MGDDKKDPTPPPPQQQPKPVNVVPAFPTEHKSNTDPVEIRAIEKQRDRG
jgi:hypothetical protein